MDSLGKKLLANKVRQVFFVHGTAVGNDPLDIFNSSIFANPLIDKGKSLIYSLGISDKLDFDLIGGKIKHLLKQAIDQVTGDVGNYTQAYVDKFCSELGHGICDGSCRFEWSGANTHRGRLKATAELAEKISDSIKTKGINADDRILLIGHSHAGQLFALLSILLQGGAVADKLVAIIEKNQWAGHLQEDLVSIKTVWLDFVTFGTPVRYRWAKYNKFRLLPVINHRSNSRLDLTAIVNVEDGDYVQQWGTDGTNLPSIEPEESILSGILENAGFDLSKALANAAKSAAENPVGRAEVTYIDDSSVVAPNRLVDYGDNRPTHNQELLYCVNKVFGHGVYTMEEKMGFNMQLIETCFYA